MVKAAVTVAGGLLSAVGAGLMVGVALLETFVVVTVPETGTCGDGEGIAQIGVFTSSFDSACADGTPAAAVYSRIADIENKPTLEFPLLFPTQFAFGGALGETADFESCEASWDVSTGPLAQTAAAAGAQGLWGKIKLGFLDSTTTKEGKATLDGLLDGETSVVTILNGLVTGLWANATRDKVVNSFVGASDAVAAIAVAIATQNCEENLVAVQAGNFSTQCSGATIHQQLLGMLQSPDTAAEQKQVLTIYAGFSQSGVPEAYDGLFGVKLSSIQSDVKKQVLNGIELFLAAVAQNSQATQQSQAEAQAGLALLELCEKQVKTIEACSADLYDVDDASTLEDSDKTDTLCTLLKLDAGTKILDPSHTLKFPSSGDTLTAADCNFHAAANVLIKDIETVLSAANVELPKSIEDPAQAGKDILEGLFKCPAPVVRNCRVGLKAQADIDFSGFPDDFSNANWLPAKITGKDNMLDLFEDQLATANATVNGLKGKGEQITEEERKILKGLEETVKGLTAFTSVLDICAAGQTFNTEECERNTVAAIDGTIAQLKAGLAQGAPVQGKLDQVVALKEGLIAAAANTLLGGSTTQELIQSCKDDNVDIEVFETAQMMVPAAIACVGAGVLVSFIAVATKKMPVALVGGILSVAGGGILMGALLYIQSEAPVYQKLKESAEAGEVPGELYYQGGTAQLLALAGVGASVVGGLVTVGSAFCGGSEESEGAITAKVDGTY